MHLILNGILQLQVEAFLSLLLVDKYRCMFAIAHVFGLMKCSNISACGILYIYDYIIINLFSFSFN